MKYIFCQILVGITLLGLTAFKIKETSTDYQPYRAEVKQPMDSIIEETAGQSGEMVINGKTYTDPVVYTSYDGALQIELWQQTHPFHSIQPANLIISLSAFDGPGTYTFNEANHTVFSISGSEEGKEAAYTSAYKDDNMHTHYGPASVKITQYEGSGKPLVGVINATLYQNGQHDKPIQVSGSFRVLVQG